MWWVLCASLYEPRTRHKSCSSRHWQHFSSAHHPRPHHSFLSTRVLPGFHCRSGEATAPGTTYAATPGTPGHDAPPFATPPRLASPRGTLRTRAVAATAHVLACAGLSPRASHPSPTAFTAHASTMASCGNGSFVLRRTCKRMSTTPMPPMGDAGMLLRSGKRLRVVAKRVVSCGALALPPASHGLPPLEPLQLAQPVEVVFSSLRCREPPAGADGVEPVRVVCEHLRPFNEGV